MTGREGDKLKGSIKGDTARAERLAAELRRNLRRRKDRARAVEAGTPVESAAPSAPDEPERG